MTIFVSSIFFETPCIILQISLHSFLWRGVILAILTMSGNIPTSKDKLISSDNQYGKKGFKMFNMKIGILLGLVDFLLSKA